MTLRARVSGNMLVHCLLFAYNAIEVLDSSEWNVCECLSVFLTDWSADKASSDLIFL